MDDQDSIGKKLKECEIQLDDAKGLSAARERLLLANIRELDDVYASLRGKIQEIKERDSRIRNLDEILTRANRLSSLGELAASIAHEIKNPLISIQGFARRIEETEETEKIQRYASVIEKEAERLSTVLMRLLDFSRMSEPRRERLDVNAIVDDTVLFIEHHLTRFKNIELTVEKGQGVAAVNVDKIHVQQALVNIVMNAAQAMPSGGPITITTGKRGEDYAWIAISDRGPGIEEEHMEKIFEPFFTTKPKGEGTGLGLSLSKRLIEANGGRIEVETRKGEGSTFKLLLPCSPDASVNEQ